MSPRPLRARWFQFSLGRLMLAVTLCAVTLGLGVPEIVGVQWWAILALIVVVVLFADWSVSHLQAGDSALRRGDYAGAVRSYTRAIAGYPHDPERYCRRAVAHYELGDLQKALDDYTTATSLDARCVPAWQSRALLRHQRREHREAIDDATVALCLVPGNADMLMIRAGAQHALGEVDEAIDDLDEVLRIDPAQADAYCLRGHGRTVRREFEAALADFDEALRLQPENLLAAVGRATALFKLGQHAKALEEIDGCLARQPDDPAALWSKAWFLATCPNDALRNAALALQLARRGEELGGGETCSCQSALAAAYAEAGLFDEAAEHARKALALAPECMRSRLERILAACEARRPYRDLGREAPE